MKQTAVEWLFERINMLCIFTDGIPDEWSEALDKAREIEKEQHKNTWFDSTAQFDNAAEMTYKKTFEHYYNQKYGNETTQELE